MAGKKNNSNGKKPPGGSGGMEIHHDHVIEFTPEGGFNIKFAARNFSQLMEHSGQSLIIHLPHVDVEFEAGCTPKEIIDGYNQAMRSRFVVKPSNANVKGGK